VAIAGAAGTPERSRTVVVGTMRRAVVVPLTGTTRLFGVRFRPGAAHPLLGVGLAQLTDAAVPLEEVWGGVGARLEASVEEAEATPERIRRVEQILTERAGRARPLHPGVLGALRALHAARGAGRVDGIAPGPIGARQLERRFREAVGISPKRLARVLRLQHAIALLRHRPPLSWSALALAAGYYDQAHLIRDFRALSGLTPLRYAREAAGVGFVQYGSVAAR